MTVQSAVRPLLLAFALAGCSGALGSEAEWPPTARKWFDRAEASFRTGDNEDARIAVDNALREAPRQPEARLLSARIALADLDYDRALAAIKDLQTTDASSVRGRAYWYSGQVERAADELEKLLADPEVRDPWAREIAKLARIGVGRKPFSISGGMIAVTDMPHAGTPSLIVPLDLNGEPTLGLVATGVAEAVIDSSGGAKPSWVSLRFADRVEVRDVPALAEDLSALSKQVGAPIKVLLGVNVLRHLRPTFDFEGGQFVVRAFDPPAPPTATTLRLSYIRGGGMLMRGTLGPNAAAQSCSLLVDTTRPFLVALDSKGWEKAGVKAASLSPVPGSVDYRQGVLPSLKLGALDVAPLQGLAGESVIKERENDLSIELDGLIGSALLAGFRVTLVDGGRTMWLEEPPREAINPPSLFDRKPSAVDEDYSDVLEEEPEEPATPGKKGKGAAKAPPPAAAKRAPAPAAPAPAKAAAPPAPANNAPKAPGGAKP